MTAKVADEDTPNQQLRQQIVVLGHKINQLASTRAVLSKAGEELWEMKGRLRSTEERGDRGKGTPSAHAEVEVLRRRAVEMEGKDEELIKMADQCRDLDRRLAEERNQCRSLKIELDKINSRINELDRIEEALGKSKQDCGALKASLEHEKDFSKMLSNELETLKVRVRELETAEGQMDKSESVIRRDLAKLRTLTVALVEDRKAIAERLRQAEEKLSNAEEKRNEQNSSAATREKLRDEKQQALRSKVDLEERIKDVVKEKDDLQGRLKTEEEKNIHLQNKIIIMKKRLQVLEQRREKEEKSENDKHIHSSVPNNTNHYCQTEDNKVKELSQEVDRLRRRLHDKESLERELLKVDEDFESLERRFQDEQKRTWALTEELQVAKKEISRYHQVEKQEVNQEHLLLCRLQREQVKSRLLGREVETLKKKVQNLTGTEESICRVQMAHSTLQKNLSQQEIRNRELAHEIEELTSELDRHRKINSSLGTPANGGHFSNPQTTKQVQTDPVSSPPPDYSSQAPIVENNDGGPNPNRKGSTPVDSLNSANNNLSQYRGQSGNETDTHQTVNREVMMLTHTPGQPLHIKVTPHHILNTATLEISSPTADTGTSYTSTAVIPTSGAATKQRITIIQNAALSALETKSISSSPNHAASPATRLFSPTSTRSATPDHSSPIQIVTVRTCSPEPTKVLNQAVYCKTPERQNAWQHQESSSTNTNSRLITTEDNKIHIHLGSSYVQSINGTTHGVPQSVGPCYVRQEQKTQVVANGCHVKGIGKITSSITITPANSPGPHPSNITVSGLCD